MTRTDAIEAYRALRNIAALACCVATFDAFVRFHAVSDHAETTGSYPVQGERLAASDCLAAARSFVANIDELAETERWDFYYRRQNNDTAKMMSDDNVRMGVAWLSADTDPADAMAHAVSEGIISKGNTNSGCFEIQGPEGIWSHRNGKRLDWSTPRRAANVEFTSWA